MPRVQEALTRAFGRQSSALRRPRATKVVHVRQPPGTRDERDSARTAVRRHADVMAGAPRMSRVRALALLRYAADELLAEQVETERNERRATWAKVGKELGVTWQAARKRYGHCDHS